MFIDPCQLGFHLSDVNIHNKKTTDELLKTLASINTVSALNDFTNSTEKNSPAQSFSEFVSEQLSKRNMTQSQLIKESQIQRNYGYQILNDTRTPGRDKVLSICLALSLSLEETQRALTLVNEGALYPKVKRVSVIIFALNKHLSVLDTNELLYDVGEPILS